MGAHFAQEDSKRVKRAPFGTRNQQNKIMWKETIRGKPPQGIVIGGEQRGSLEPMDRDDQRPMAEKKGKKEIRDPEREDISSSSETRNSDNAKQLKLVIRRQEGKSADVRSGGKTGYNTATSGGIKYLPGKPGPDGTRKQLKN